MPIFQAAKNFDGGFQTDTPRNMLPPGTSYRMKDWMPRAGSPLRRRGTWRRVSPQLTDYGAGNVGSVCFVPHSQGNHFVSVGGLGAGLGGPGYYLYRHTSFSSATDVGLIGLNGYLYDRPVFHRDLTILTPVLAAGSAAKVRKYYWTGAAWAIADLGGTPPQAQIAASWGDYLILANDPVSGAHSNRMYFSAVGNAESWPANNSVDAPENVVGLAVKGSVIFVFGANGVHIITGDTPPPGGNLSFRKWVFRQGCMDSRSICQYKDQVYWANPSGLWRSDGTTITSLTDLGGIASYWRSLFAGAGAGSTIVATGVYQHFLVVSIRDQTNSTSTTLVCDLEREVWYEWTSIRSYGFDVLPSGGSPDGHEHLIFANGGEQYVGTLRGCFDPDDATYGVGSADDDGFYIHPVLETAFFTLGNNQYKRFKRAFIEYAIDDSQMNMEVVLTPENQTATALRALPATSSGATLTAKRHSVHVDRKAMGAALKLTAAGNSDDVRLWGIELEATPLGDVRADAS